MHKELLRLGNFYFLLFKGRFIAGFRFIDQAYQIDHKNSCLRSNRELAIPFCQNSNIFPILMENHRYN